MDVGSIRLDTRRLDQIAAKLDTNAEGAVKRTALWMEGRTKYYIQVKKVIDTGAYFNSIQAESKAPLLWWVHDGVEYGIYQEFGTYKLAARPCFAPALTDTEKVLDDIMAQELFK